MHRSVVDSAMLRAVEAAAAFRGSTSPNPPVGCVLLDSHGAQLAIEAHRRAGEPHAEAKAIASCRNRGIAERIHTAVVTLEPCNHSGRTPPCTEALLSTPVREIWIGLRDPNPFVRGGGAAHLAAAGLQIHFAESETLDACRELLGPFRKRVLTALPWVTLKQALTPGGSMIPPAGRKTFTSDASLDFAHQLRKRADALLTGSGTILADDPHFTVRRIADFPDKRRILVIMDRRGRVPNSYIEMAARRGFEVWVERDIDEALQKLGERGVLEVLVEAGPTLTSSLLKHGRWDEHFVITRQAEPGMPDNIKRILNHD